MKISAVRKLVYSLYHTYHIYANVGFSLSLYETWPDPNSRVIRKDFADKASALAIQYSRKVRKLDPELRDIILRVNKYSYSNPSGYSVLSISEFQKYIQLLEYASQGSEYPDFYEKVEGLLEKIPVVKIGPMVFFNSRLLISFNRGRYKPFTHISLIDAGDSPLFSLREKGSKTIIYAGLPITKSITPRKKGFRASIVVPLSWCEPLASRLASRLRFNESKTLRKWIKGAM